MVLEFQWIFSEAELSNGKFIFFKSGSQTSTFATLRERLFQNIYNVHVQTLEELLKKKLYEVSTKTTRLTLLIIQRKGEGRRSLRRRYPWLRWYKYSCVLGCSLQGNDCTDDSQPPIGEATRRIRICFLSFVSSKYPFFLP